MNENCLLHSETAKKLYFEYARDLPVISFSAHHCASNRVFSNVTEAFILNDYQKLDAMRQCGVDEKYISGDASDYEKFKAFTSILPKFAGNPIYITSHIEFNKFFGCDLDINEENCDALWNIANAVIENECLSESKMAEMEKGELVPVVYLDWYDELLSNKEVNDLGSLINVLVTKMNIAEQNGCKKAFFGSFLHFVKPNPYKANEIVVNFKSGKTIPSQEDIELLDMQVLRTICLEAKARDWTLFFSAIGRGDFCSEVEKYLKDNHVFPKIQVVHELVLGQSEEFLENILRAHSLHYPIGDIVYTFNANNRVISYPEQDYFRRTLCNIIGTWVENGEYTSDEKILKELIQNIFYNNLKEAIS